MKSLWGIPIVVGDSVPEGRGFIGRIPTVEEVELHGSFEAALRAITPEWIMLKGLEPEERNKSMIDDEKNLKDAIMKVNEAGKITIEPLNTLNENLAIFDRALTDAEVRYVPFTAPECNYFGKELPDHTRIFIDKKKQVIKFIEESENSVTIVIEPKQ